MSANGIPHWSIVSGKPNWNIVIVFKQLRLISIFFCSFQALKISPADNEKLDKVLTQSLDKAKISLSAFGLEQTEDELSKKFLSYLVIFF
jgi:Dof, BCAP, and BANK (DBB) motif,